MSVTLESVEQKVRTNANPDFRFEHNETTPFVQLTKKIHEAKGALISTGGIFVKTYPPFNDNYGIGDPSYREIPSDISINKLSRYHEHYDHTNAMKDINCVFPIERMRQLQSSGVIGSLAETFYSFMGYLTVTHPLKTITAPEVARKMHRENVDFAVLVPV
ncbi:glycine/sarcosine/betaine reductase selenoprotein B family protein [Desulfitobacterium sp.]|uniref:glycine/sarcosine/betaine reductase selenoprotein B family protein n=1 Tax=Desulfitobacterium sp. TaxID=49981 RepID=UPI002C5BD3B2|nr:glycine/sarcosine/betaine reductase selenoprotein B family protein [Desulfitobacterium sp.]HVJ49713.1 glycine/sarcosine/betaine reductase selenoprotein B family protein [Desulfitobacterium sp.]